MKKLLSVILAMVLCFAMVTPCLAAEENEEKKIYPHIYVHGFMGADIYVDTEDPDAGKAWPLESKNIASTVSKMLKPINELCRTKDLDRFGEQAAVIIDELLSPVCLDYSGEICNTSGIIAEYPELEDIEKEYYFQFSYDWRIDPIETAKELDKYINYILECYGAEKIVLECHSLGGVITLTYIELFGTDKIQSVMFDTTAIYGESYTGELFKSEVNLTDEGVRSYLDFVLDGMNFKTILSCLVDSITDMGVMNYACEHLNEIVDVLMDEVELSIMKMFANWPTIWAMVPDEMLEDAKANVFGRVYAENNIDSSALQQKVDNYSSLIRSKKGEILKDTDNSVNLYVISRYGYSSLPLTASWQTLSDGIVDTTYSSFGATTAKYGENLDVAESEYISPDKTVDASTCFFPEQTWFIKDMKHMVGCADKNELVDTLLYYDGQATVDTFEQYPRFLEHNAKYGYIIPDPGEGFEANVQRFAATIKAIFENAFGKIFSLFSC